MEFHHGLWNGVSALYSDSGRQLGEENTRPFSLNHHVPADKIVCKYSGSRAGKAINMSALRTAMQNFGDALALTGAVRSFHLGQTAGEKAPGIWDLYIIARASIALIAYQKRFAGQADPKASVSDILSSQYQFISGVFMICRHMMENADPAIACNAPQTAEALYSYADQNGIFISFNDMACAGSTKKIMEFLSFCNDGKALTEPLRVSLEDFVTEPENWYRYALATVELDCFVEGGRLTGQSQQIYADLQAYVRCLMKTPPQDEREEGFREGVLRRQNHILELLGRRQIRAISPKHFDLRMR